MMRKVVLGCGVSLDGYIARKDGSVDFLTMDPEYDFAGFMATVDTWLLGRKTLDESLKLGAEYGGEGDLRTIVFSRSRPPGKRDGIEFTDRSPADVVADLRRSEGKDLWLGGGGELAREFLRARLVDRIELGIVPVLIGSGLPLFPEGFPQQEFRLTRCQSFKKTGLVALSYERA